MNKTVSIHAKLNEHFLIQTDIRGHHLSIDQPQSAGGQDEGVSPLEMFLFTLAGCIGSIARIMAMQQRLNLRGMSIEVSGDYDPAGLLGKATDQRMGFQQLFIQAQLDCDLSPVEQAAFFDQVCARCPVHDNIQYSTAISHNLL